MGVGRLCFGTSTFVAGRLRPDKDSTPGIDALRAAVLAGVRLVHSNPKLGTQWAIRKALDTVDSAMVGHLVKAEVPLDADPGAIRSGIMRAVDDSCDALDVDKLDAVTVEIDLKRTRDESTFGDSYAVEEFYATTAEVAFQSGRLSRVIAYCHSPAHLQAALRADGLHGVAAQYNVIEPWAALFLEAIEGKGLEFVGMSPLQRGALAGISLPHVPSGDQPLSAIRWAAAEPRVAFLVATMSSILHLRQAIEAMNEPLPAESAQQAAIAWLSTSAPRFVTREG